MLLSVSSRPSVPFFLLIPTTFLLIAYIYAVYTRPKVPPHAKVNDPGKFGWPEWYRKGGIIPYDVYPLSEEGRSLTDVRKSVLLFIDLPCKSISGSTSTLESRLGCLKGHDGVEGCRS